MSAVIVNRADCAVCLHPQQSDIDIALCSKARSTVAKRYKVPMSHLERHLAHTTGATATGPDGVMKRNFNSWVDLGGNLSLAGARKTLRGRRDIALAAPLLARLAQFAELAGKASGALQEPSSVANVQTNVVLMPRSEP